jgi:hypothetical protein
MFSYSFEKPKEETSMTDNREHLIDFAAYLKDLAAVSDPDKEADVLLLTCMDFRFFLDIAVIMKEQNLKYDHVTLAGAALGAVWRETPHWHQMFLDHLRLAIKLHKIKAVLVLEHRTCGAYGPTEEGGFGLLPKYPTPDQEEKAHDDQVKALKLKMPSDLGFRALLLDAPKGTDALTFDQLI